MADVYGGENDITSFRQIYRGEIGPVMVLSSTDTIAGSAGVVVGEILSNTDATQAKVDTL